MADGSVPLVLSPEPFSREVAYLEQPAGRTLRAALLDAVKSGAIAADDLSRTVVYVDGERLERDQTLDHVLAEGEVVNIVVEPLGGGGRKDVGQILMTIAVIAVSMWVGGGGTALGTTLLARVAAAAILTLGQAAVAAMFAPETDNKAKVNERYALQTASNQYRPWAPQPIALGEVVVAPDFAAKTYTQSVGDEVWLHGILGLHRGPCTVADLKIGDTLASSMGPGDFRMVEHLTPGPRTFTIYPNDADQLDLQEELEATTSSATTVVRAGSAEGEQFDFDFFLPGGLHFQKDDGRVLTASVSVYTRYRPVDEDGNPTGAGTWSTGPTVALSSTTKEPMRVTRSVSLPMGRYEFEFKRSLKPDDNEKRRDRIALTAIRSIAFRKPVADETLSLIEFAVRATALNQGTLAPITCRITPICEEWNGTAWGSPAPTSNPAALTRWLLTGPAPARPLLSAQADTRLRAWSALCETYNWRVGIYLQDERRQDQVLALLEQAGRASLWWDGTQMVAAAWVEKPAPRQLFTGSNLRDHKWTLVYPEPVHALRVEFQNIEEGGDPDEIYVYADGYAETAGPGVEAATLVEALRLEGQKTPERAYRDGRWELGARLHRRRIDTWTADVEYLVSSYGDRVRLAWQRVEGGTSTRIRCRRWAGGLVSGLRLAQPVEMKPGESYAADIRLPSGVALAVPLINEASTEAVITREVQFAVPRAPELAPRRDDLIAFGVPSKISEDTEIIGVEPGEGLTAVLTGVRYVAPLLMAGETGPIPALTTRLSRQRQANPPAPRLLGVQPDPSGVRVSFDVPPWAGSPIVAYSARWRPTPTGGAESGWLALPPLDANARTLITPPPRALPVPVDQDDETLIDIELRAVTAAGQTSPVPLLIEGLAVRDTPFMPTNVSVTPATRTAPDGSSHGVLVFQADALDAAVSTDMIVEVRRYPPGGGAPDGWEASGLTLPANNPTGDILGLRAGTAYGTRAAFRTSDGWYSDWTAEIVRTVPSGSNVAGDVTPIIPGNVAGTPTLSAATLIAPDGTQISRMSGTWTAPADALSYVVELDNGSVSVQIPTTSNAISQIVPTGPSYRYRVKALSRTGTPSAAWSSWSATVSAAGDTTPPGVITSPYIQAGPRYIALGWTNPTDTDLKAVVIYRHTVNSAGAASLLRIVDGTSFTDTTASPGTTYYYWATTVDRSGNESARTSIGAATARYINVGGGDIRSDDPDLVTDYGIAAGYKFQSRFGTALTLSLADSDIQAPWTALDNRPAVTQGNSLTEDQAMSDPSAWGLSSCNFYGPAAGAWAGAIVNNLNSSASFSGMRAVPVDRNKTYLLEGGIYASSTPGTLSTTYGGVDVRDETGTSITGDGTYWLYSPAGVQPPLGVVSYYSKVFGAGTSRPLPAAATTMRIIGFPNYGNVAGALHYFFGWRIVEVIRIGGNLYRTDGTVATEGDVVTGLGTAAAIVGQGSGATANNLSGLNSAEGLKFGTISPNAGSSLVLTPYNANTTVVGNSAKRSGASGGWDTGAASADKYVGSAFCAFRAINGPYLMAGLCNTFNGSYTSIDYAWYFTGSAGSTPVGIYELGSSTAFPVAAGAWSESDVWSVAYDGVKVRYLQNGVVRHTSVAVAGQKLGFATSIVLQDRGVTDVQFGPSAQAARVGDLWNAAGTAQYGQASIVTAEGVANAILNQGPGATALANRVMNERLENNVRLVPNPDGGTLNVGSPQPGQLQIVLPFGAAHGSMLNFDIDIYDYNLGTTVTYRVGGYMYNTTPPVWINHAALYMGPRGFARPVKFGYYLGKGYIWIGSVGDTWSYSVVSVKDVKIGYQSQSAAWESGWSVTLNNTDVSSLVNQTVAVPRAGDQVFGEGLLEENGGAVATKSNFKTGLGVSASYVGATAWGLLTRSTSAISKIDDAGRIIDGQALPLNGMSKSSTLNPSHPFSAGATPTTQINVAAVVATFAGGTTLSIGSATISGLTASTYYSIFRDLVAGSYVAVSGSTTAYFTSAQRYLYIGTQATEEVGGGYEPLPPPPPGSGGGYGDIPMYVEP